MPKTAFADALHARKYRLAGETFREAMCRVANAMATDSDHYYLLRPVLMSQRFLPGGRIQSAMGSPRQVTAANCFVSGGIADSFTEGPGSIMARASEAAETMRRGGGIGYDFSTLRPSGARISSLGSQSSGPVAFMGIFDAICKCVASAGQRRGAQMGVLRIDHPDITAFIRAKSDTTSLTGFNLSVAVTDDFMRLRQLGGARLPLIFDGLYYGHADVDQLWEMLMRSTWDHAEPGVLFIDRINNMNNLWYCEDIAATNPCAEQPLPPHGACILGSFNVTKYVRDRAVDVDQLARDVPLVVEAMDNVISRTPYPIEAQRVEAHSKRRMGLGVTGMANALEVCGHRYGSDSYLAAQSAILSTIRDAAYLASAKLAEGRGPFELYNREKYLGGGFTCTLPPHVRDAIASSGIRNSHLTSIAPTGTISMCADNVSSGIEPVFAHSVHRVIDGEIVTLDDWAVREHGVRGATVDEVSIAEHLSVLAAAQRYVDSSVSKTINAPSTVEWADFKRVYSSAWELGCKGCATYTVGGSRSAVITDGATCDIDPATGKISC